MSERRRQKVQVGDVIIVMSYAMMEFEEAKSFKPTVVIRIRHQQARLTIEYLYYRLP